MKNSFRIAFFFNKGRWKKTLIRMKLCAMLMLIGVLKLSANVKGQNALVSMNMYNANLIEFFSEITDQTDYEFLYNHDLVSEKKTISLEIEQQDLKELLKDVLHERDLDYELDDDVIIISERTDAISAKEPISVIQNKKIKGRVTDENGVLLPGVSVFVKGTTIGTVTSIDGEYAIELPVEHKVIVFSFVGMKTQEVVVGNKKVIDVSLVKDAQGLDEVVIVGFGKQKKASVIASINTVKPDALRLPTSSLSTTLAGRLAGVISVQRSGEPGADGADFWIRGVSTFGSNKKPLILVDGIEVTTGDLNDMDPENIENFSILKDASATALYGVRGANGVILITTKVGKALPRPKISIRLENSITKPTKMPEFTDGVNYMEMYNEAILTRDPFLQPKYSQEKIDGTRQALNPYIFPNVDWYNTLFKDFSMSQRANLNVRGGSEKIQYYLSTSMFHDNGMLKVPSINDFNTNIDIKRYNFRNNITVKLSPTTKVDLKITAFLEDYTGPEVSPSSIFGEIMDSNPVDFPVIFPKQNNEDHILYGNKSGSLESLNPYAQMLKGYLDNFSATMFTNLHIDQKLNFITKGLSVNGLASFQTYNSTSVSRSMKPFYYEVGKYALNSETNDYDFTVRRIGNSGQTALDFQTSGVADRTYYFQTAVNYDREFGEHALTGMLVYSQKEYADANPYTFYSSLPYRTQGLAGRFTYSFDDRYFAEYNFGYNGSENFISGKRFGFFPSYAMGYIVSNEKFFENIKPIVSLLKFKASYGLVGNDQVGGRFPYLDEVDLDSSSRGFTFGQNFDVSRSGIEIEKYGNPDARWEVGRKINLGLELSLFDKLTLQADVFRERRSGIFMKRNTVPSTVGIGNAKPFANLGKVENKGFDASLEYNDNFGDFIFSFKANFTYATNKVLEIDEPTLKYPYLSEIGRPINQLWGLDAEHLFIDEAEIANSPKQTYSSVVLPGDIKYRDVSAKYDGMSRIDNNDRIPMGHPSIPEIVYGFGASMKYKKLDFSLFFQGVTNVSFFITKIHPFAQYDRNVLKAIADDYWTKENQNIHAFYPRLSATENTNNTQKSSKWLRNGGFLRLKNAEIGYTFNKLRVFANGTNLLTFSKFDLWDPEMGGGNGLGYPPQKVFNIGAQINF
ncbi:MAG: TonB-dependent receptor [Marinifilum sp.]|jgi:TonB-linked SusC/RagA family outer membrane protein|nr:TonB-dependent receptor [Marinifilum sp.]